MERRARQTIELTKDFQKEKACADIAVTTRQDKAEYVLSLHIEYGLVRDNQIRLANTEGDVLYSRKAAALPRT